MRRAVGAVLSHASWGHLAEVKLLQAPAFPTSLVNQVRGRSPPALGSRSMLGPSKEQGQGNSHPQGDTAHGQFSRLHRHVCPRGRLEFGCLAP